MNRDLRDYAVHQQVSCDVSRKASRPSFVRRPRRTSRIGYGSALQGRSASIIRNALRPIHCTNCWSSNTSARLKAIADANLSLVEVKKPYVENSVTAGGIAVPQFNQELCFKRFEVRDWNFQEPPLPSHHASARRRLARPLTPPPAPPSTRPTDRSPSARSTR